MSLNNAKKAQFMKRRSSFSTRGSRRGMNLLGWEEDENLTVRQMKECCDQAVEQLRGRLANCTTEEAMRRRDIRNGLISAQYQQSVLKECLKGSRCRRVDGRPFELIDRMVENGAGRRGRKKMISLAITCLAKLEEEYSTRGSLEPGAFGEKRYA